MLLVFCSVILPPAHHAICHPFKWVLAHTLNLCTLQLLLPLKFFSKHVFVRLFNIKSKLKLFTFIIHVPGFIVHNLSVLQRKQDNYLYKSLPLWNDFLLGERYEQNLISCNMSNFTLYIMIQFLLLFYFYSQK